MVQNKHFPEIHGNFGFGCMRLPIKGGQVDCDEFCRMADAFIASGLNYFDTAHGYIGGRSETAIRDCVAKRYDRSKFLLTDKLTAPYFKKQEDIRPFFENQLKWCGVDYFDFYLMHAQDRNNYQKFKRCKAYETCQREQIDALVVIGGNGSLTGARNFAMEYDFPVVGLPGTIDNDLYGTDSTIGYDTTMNTIMECVDRIRDTANSHERIFFVEVMGRDAGFLALNSAIACGAEAALIPEEETDADQLKDFMARGIRKSKKSCIVIVSESPKCGALYYADRVKKEFPEFDVRVSILGHMQRGGSPSAHDRILASRTGVGAIKALMQGQRNVMIGVRNNEVVFVPFSEAIRSDKPFNKGLIKVLDELSI